MTRFLDIILSLTGLLFLAPFLLFFTLLGYFDTGSPFFVQKRIGRDQKVFSLIKFRTMKPGTIDTATHLLDGSVLTRFGGFLRKYKIDELPQLWNVLIGDMSLVGPRPCLPVQTELISERQSRSVFKILPGITGLAQVRGIDMSNPKMLAEIDQELMERYSLSIYARLILVTLLGSGFGDRLNINSSKKINKN
jgi:O-antigen biosynthesis protein WbqP